MSDSVGSDRESTGTGTSTASSVKKRDDRSLCSLRKEAGLGKGLGKEAGKELELEAASLDWVKPPMHKGVWVTYRDDGLLVSE